MTFENFFEIMTKKPVFLRIFILCNKKTIKVLKFKVSDVIIVVDKQISKKTFNNKRERFFMSMYEEKTARTEWFRNDRFGMFIHWGIYSIPARGEWVRSPEKMSVEEYQKYFDAFDPKYYDPKKWAKVAKNAGMKYAVMTAKHHDGFCLFDSKLTDYKATNTPAGRDLIKEYVEAFRAEGIKVGIYYSLIDWHHDDYPHYGDAIHPMRENEEWKDYKHNFSNYIEYMHGQVRELMTNYGKIDIMWFDFSYDEMRDEKWEATKLVKMIRSINPDIIIDDRLSMAVSNGNMSFDYDTAPYYTGDFKSPEQVIPVNGLKDAKGRAIPWEACITLNNNWGYVPQKTGYKKSKDVIRMLVECVSKNGNMILNVGPNAKGEIPKESIKILEEIGEWMHENDESIYGCGQAVGFDKPEWGRYTMNGKKLYAHVFDRGISSIMLDGLKGKVKSARLLSDYSEMQFSEPFFSKNNPTAIYLNIPEGLPDEKDTVVEFELN